MAKMEPTSARGRNVFNSGKVRFGWNWVDQRKAGAMLFALALDQHVEKIGGVIGTFVPKGTLAMNYNEMADVIERFVDGAPPRGSGRNTFWRQNMTILLTGHSAAGARGFVRVPSRRRRSYTNSEGLAS